MLPITDVFAQTDRFINAPVETRYYFIAAHTIDGGRFYSPSFTDVMDAVDCYQDYVDMVKYFGGGIIELFRIDEIDFDIISVSRV